MQVLSIVDTALHLMKSPSGSSSIFTSNQPFAGLIGPILESTVTGTEPVKELILDFSYIGVSLIDSIPQVFDLLRRQIRPTAMHDALSEVNDLLVKMMTCF